MVDVRTASLIKGKRDRGVTRSERQTHYITLSSQGGRKGKERGKLGVYLPGLQRDALWVESAGLGQESDSSVIYAAGTKMGLDQEDTPRRLANHQSELVFRSSWNLSPSARDTSRPSAPV